MNPVVDETLEMLRDPRVAFANPDARRFRKSGRAPHSRNRTGAGRGTGAPPCGRTPMSIASDMRAHPWAQRWPNLENERARP